ncbi:hypothetical protein NX059_011016 [Plenodomus lindquistii]|nr:hypothetical protein NX059_011016 [Plenodomus lindquistii]
MKLPLAALAALGLAAAAAAATSSDVEVESSPRNLSLITPGGSSIKLAGNSKTDIGVPLKTSTPIVEIRDLADSAKMTAAAADSEAIKHPNIIYKPFKDESGNSGINMISSFHVNITDYCDIGGQRQVKATYTSNDLYFKNLWLWPQMSYPLSLGYKGFPNLTIGDFDYKSSRLRFAYKDCVWYDDETWKECGECRAAHWSGTAPPCSKDEGPPLTREMDCSMILGVIKTPSLSGNGSPDSNNQLTNNTLPPKPAGNGTLVNETLPNITIPDSHIPHFNLTLANTIPVALAPRNTAPLPSVLLSATDSVTSSHLPLNYEPGTCRYTMTVLQICSPTASTSYTTTFGYVFSIADNSGAPIMLYPEGVGRIDAGAKRLGGLQDFRLAWDTNHGVAYFSNGLKWWKSDNNYGEGEKENKNPGGGCDWQPWDKEDLQCDGGKGGGWRVSEMSCEFEC